MRRPGVVRQPREDVDDHGRLVRVGQREGRPGNAPLDEERPALVVPREQPNGAVAVPPGERVRLVVGLEVRRRVQLENGVPGRHDERERRVVRLLELEPPGGRALRGEARQRLEPLGLAPPRVCQGRRRRGARVPTTAPNLRVDGARLNRGAVVQAAG